MCPILSESRESVINDLTDLGVRVGDILQCQPTFGQLKRMRDELTTLFKALENYPIPRPDVFYIYAAGGFSEDLRDDMK
jgi:hypothetical protein